MTHSLRLPHQAYVKGDWMDADQGHTFPVFNPATGQEIGQVADLGARETLAAIDAAYAAQPAWAAKTAAERGKILRRWLALIIERKDYLAEVLSLEQGKSLKESVGEVLYGATYVDWYIEEAKRAYGDVIPSTSEHKLFMTMKQPVGVVGAITPWNFPSAMITRKTAPALAVGCTVVLKPSEETPYSALALAELAHEAGIPPGVFNIVPSNQAQVVGECLTQSEKVRKFTFTGSTAVGKKLMAQSASNVKKVSLELGGNAPFIVFDDADLDIAVRELMGSKFRNSGQVCVCPNRIFVQEGVARAFAERIAEAAKDLKIGAYTDEGAQVGPLINEKALAKVDRLVADAVHQGAEVLLGGKRAERGDHFYAPTVLYGVTDAMAIAQEEIFGPVVAVYPFKTEEEVIERANNTPYGLAAYFFSENVNRIFRVAKAIESGMIGINASCGINSEATPFGGVKSSGLGREGSRMGLEDFLETKYLCWAHGG